MSLQLSCLSEDFGVTGVEKVEVAKRVSCLKHLALPLALPREACKIIGFLVRLTWEVIVYRLVLVGKMIVRVAPGL
jgi:hypothetical protein